MDFIISLKVVNGSLKVRYCANIVLNSSPIFKMFFRTSILVIAKVRQITKKYQFNTYVCHDWHALRKIHDNHDIRIKIETCKSFLKYNCVKYKLNIIKKKKKILDEKKLSTNIRVEVPLVCQKKTIGSF